MSVDVLRPNNFEGKSIGQFTMSFVLFLLPSIYVFEKYRKTITLREENMIVVGSMDTFRFHNV